MKTKKISCLCRDFGRPLPARVRWYVDDRNHLQVEILEDETKKPNGVK